MLIQPVNFFGHAAVASWRSPSAGTVLGAMLPDFATMAGLRLPASADPDVQAGIALHHATDAAFHTLPPVLALMRDLDARLAALGCARGPRRAASHIGIELLLDGILVDDPTYRDAYTRALAHDDPTLTFATQPPDRFHFLLARLRAHGVPYDLQSPDAITLRLSRMLAHRPLLAPSRSDLAAIAQALRETNRDAFNFINLLRASL
jgi:acyl carrier protein phosphodiesterase